MPLSRMKKEKANEHHGKDQAGRGQQHPAAPPVLNFVFIIEGRGPPSLLQAGCSNTDFAWDRLHGAFLFSDNGGLGQLSGAEDIFVPIPVEVCQKEEKEEKPGQAEKKPRPPGTQPKAGGENPAQPTAHWKELYRQTDRSVNYSGPTVGRGRSRIPRRAIQPPKAGRE